MGRRLIWVTLGIAAVVIVAGIVAGKEVLLMVEAGIALAVASVPEGLPIVATVALARGMAIHGADLKELDSLTPQEQQHVLQAPIFARVSPKQSRWPLWSTCHCPSGRCRSCFSTW